MLKKKVEKAQINAAAAAIPAETIKGAASLEKFKSKKYEERARFIKIMAEGKKIMSQKRLEIEESDRAYIPQGFIGILEYHTDKYIGPKYLATSGIAPCVGITIYSSATGDRIVMLGHFDSTNEPNMAEYINFIATKVPASFVVEITLIPSSTTFSVLSKKSVLETDILKLHVRVLSQEMMVRIDNTPAASVHIYDRIVSEIKRLLPYANLKLAPFQDIEGAEDVSINVYTGEIKRYKENSNIVSLQPQKGGCSREDFNIPQNMNLYFLEGGQLRSVKFTEDGTVANSVLQQVPFPPSSASLILTSLHGFRKGLKEAQRTDLSTLLQLPVGFKIGAAVDDGGCFFDALAQALNRARNTEEFSEKRLRLSCHEYYMSYKEEVDAWNCTDGVMGGIKDEDYSFVQYTKPELDEHFNRRIPVWGRPHIEGRILCRQLKIELIHLIELSVNPEDEQLIVTHYVITSDGEKQLAELLPYSNDIPTIIVSQKELHFVPISRDVPCLEAECRDSLSLAKAASIAPQQ